MHMLQIRHHKISQNFSNQMFPFLLLGLRVASTTTDICIWNWSLWASFLSWFFLDVPVIPEPIEPADDLCADVIYISDFSNVEQAELIELDSTKFHNSKNCRAGLILSGFDEPLIELTPIQNFVEKLKPIIDSAMNSVKNAIGSDSNYHNDLRVAHEMLRVSLFRVFQWISNDHIF